MEENEEREKTQHEDKTEGKPKVEKKQRTEQKQVHPSFPLLPVDKLPQEEVIPPFGLLVILSFMEVLSPFS